MKKKSLLFILFILVSAVKSWSITATVKGRIASQIHESSGLDFSGSSSFYTHNDGYGDNKIYKLNTTGAFSKSITVTNAVNHDWEDITHNEARTKMFIGDFGNNNCNRTDLRVYIIPYPSTISGTTTTATTIKFTYPDQKKIPSKWLNFDVEAFFHHNGKLYLFTKADGNAIGYTKLYTLPDVAGTYVATLVDSFPTSQRITGASISPDGSSAVIMSNTKIYLFRNWTGTNIFNGTSTKISIDGSWTQKEGISFFDNKTVYISDEGAANKLYSVNLTSYITSPRLSAPEVTEETQVVDNHFSIYPNPSSSFVNVRFEEGISQLEVIITDLSGKIVKQESFSNPSMEIRLETDNLASGMYAVNIIADQRRQKSMLLNVAK